MGSYVYKKTEPSLWTVGFYDPDGRWNAESDHDHPDNAADRVAFLNGMVRSKGEDDFLSQALNEGDGVYRP